MTADRMLQTAKQEHDLLDNYQSANFLGFSPATMRNSRYTGLLAGVPAPSFRKIGRKSVRYERATLTAWLAQFAECASTSAVTRNPQPPHAA